jgi:hypothetical protein
MKRQIVSVLAFVAVYIFVAQAQSQVLNGDFETLRSDGAGPRHWGSLHIMPFPSPCGTLILDSSFYLTTSDAHSGNWALELRNAKCTSDNELFGGTVHLMESDSSYFDSGTEYFDGVPTQFSFYYKFLPVGDDTAKATVTLSNDFAGDLATETILIGKAASTYTKATVPINYQIASTPTRINITFATQTETSTPSFGTRLLIDDVEMTSEPNSVASNIKADVHCYPNPATSVVNFTGGSDAAETLSIFNVSGNRVFTSAFENAITVDCSKFSAGLYFYRLGSSSGSFVVN